MPSPADHPRRPLLPGTGTGAGASQQGDDRAIGKWGCAVGVSRRSLRWAVPTIALVVLLAWGVLGGGIRLGAAPAPAGPSPAGPFPTGEVTVGGGPLVVPLPTDHLRRIRLLPAAPHDARRLTWNLFGRQDGGRKLLLFVDVSCTRIVGAIASELGSIGCRVARLYRSAVGGSASPAATSRTSSGVLVQFA